MKKCLLALLVLLSLQLVAQKKSKGYAQLTPTFVVLPNWDNFFGMTAAVGYSPNGFVGIGGGIDFFVFSKKKPKFGQGYVDLRVFLAKPGNKVSPFIAVQPGFIIYRQSANYSPLTIDSKGSFAANVLVGLQAKPITVNMGYTYISFKTKLNNNNTVANFSGARVSIGIGL